MALETKEQIDQFMILQQKDAAELRAVCEGVGLAVEGTKTELINRLITEEPATQIDVLQPQAIPLRTKDDQGKQMPEILKVLREWRKILFNAKDNEKEFTLLNAQGQTYIKQMKYIPCTKNVLEHILKNRWYDPQYMQHTDLINQLVKSPEKFSVHIVQKNTPNNSSFVMLHVEPN